MRHILQRVLGAFAGFTLTCAMTIVAAAQTAAPPRPDAKAIVLRYLRTKPPVASPEDLGTGPGGLFGAPEKLGLLEISQPSPVQHPTLGRTWLACLRTHPADKPARDYALFMTASRIQDARLSIVSDRCAARTYQILGVFGAAAEKMKEKSGKNARPPRRNDGGR